MMKWRKKTIGAFGSSREATPHRRRHGGEKQSRRHHVERATAQVGLWAPGAHGPQSYGGGRCHSEGRLRDACPVIPRDA